MEPFEAASWGTGEGPQGGPYTILNPYLQEPPEVGIQPSPTSMLIFGGGRSSPAHPVCAQALLYSESEAVEKQTGHRPTHPTDPSAHVLDT